MLNLLVSLDNDIVSYNACMSAQNFKNGSVRSCVCVCRLVRNKTTSRQLISLSLTQSQNEVIEYKPIWGVDFLKDISNINMAGT